MRVDFTVENISRAEVPIPSRGGYSKWSGLLKDLQPGQAKKITFENCANIENQRSAMRTQAKVMNLKVGTSVFEKEIYVFLKS